MNKFNQMNIFWFYLIVMSVWLIYIILFSKLGISRGRDRMVVGFITTYAISAYHH